MYENVIKELRALEEQMAQAKVRAQAQARETLESAEKAGRDLLRDTRQAIREADEAAMEAGRAEAGRRREAVLHAAEADCQALRDRAERGMDEAVALIVGRVVGR